MNDLLQTMVVAGGPAAQWAGSTENLDGSEGGDTGITGSSRRGSQRLKELALSTNAIDFAALMLPTVEHSRAKLRLQVKGQNASLHVLFLWQEGIKQAFSECDSTFHIRGWICRVIWNWSRKLAYVTKKFE